jgi:acyl-CoA dehydrogenase
LISAFGFATSASHHPDWVWEKLYQRAASAVMHACRKDTVFGRPIGKNQGIQHPLAESWALLESAYWMCLRAAWLYDNKLSCGAEANAAKLLAARAGFDATTKAVLTHGGMGYAREFHVERLFRESLLPRIGPVSEQLILSFIAEKVLDLPKSY